MSYTFAEYRPYVFTEEGQVTFLNVRDKAKHLIKEAGAARMDKITQGLVGLTWNHLACVDRLVELGELIEVTNPSLDWGQYRLFTEKVYP